MFTAGRAAAYDALSGRAFLPQLRNGVDAMLIHVVQPGDTIWKLSQRYHVSMQRIIEDNGLAGQPYLVIGQALLILFPEYVHIVRRGETLYSIAHHYGMNMVALMRNNPRLIFDRRLQEGQELVLRYFGQSGRAITTNGYAYPYVKPDVLLQSLPCMTNFTPFGYGFTLDGELIDPNDLWMLRESYIYNAVPVLLLSSITEEGTFSGERASALFCDTGLQEKVIDNLILEMNKKGYWGLDIDFEYIPPADGEAFLAFLRYVTDRMHQNGFFVNVDLAPKTSSEQAGLLYESHNYAAIGAIADTVLLMTYEWGYTLGPPMAVAPVDKVEQVVAYAVTQIPAEKIMLGVPNYGYDWKLPFERGVTVAQSIGNEEALLIAAENGAIIEFDEKAQSPFFTYWAKDGSEHIVWFEDVRSIRAKFNLVNAFGLRGVGYWNLMRPFSQNWMLLGQMFSVEKLI